jgi:hypothetical protein
MTKEDSSGFMVMVKFFSTVQGWVLKEVTRDQDMHANGCLAGHSRKPSRRVGGRETGKGFLDLEFSQVEMASCGARLFLPSGSWDLGEQWNRCPCHSPESRSTNGNLVVYLCNLTSLVLRTQDTKCVIEWKEHSPNFRRKPCPTQYAENKQLREHEDPAHVTGIPPASLDDP